MNIAICENDPADSNEINGILNRYMEQYGYTGEIYTFSSGEDFLASFSVGLYDIIFLDIYMDGINGVDTARAIRETDSTCALVFITTSLNHALDGFSVRASAYVVKPIQEKDMQTALYQCRELFLRNARYIEIRSDRNVIKLPLIKIFFVEIYDKDALFHTSDGLFKTRMTMEEIETKLGGKPFFRCHKSYIINMNHIKKLDRQDFIMKNGEIVPIRTRGREDTRAAVADFLSNRIFE